MMKYEATQPREVYKTALKQLWPDWPRHDSDIKINFYDAVLQCIVGVFLKKVSRWVNHIEAGYVVSWAQA
ncbi:putative kinase-like protein [Rosellinia necatrix]|uniref:Putative kinase-like protein n=1 Tax=Rosellinia necatrix TaxID=77044 RepID=A0A1S8A6T9_ROSNE|nr:putative kinase-like protein [Rosellinia necatrix]